MKHPKNTPHVQGIWFMPTPDETEACYEDDYSVYLLFLSADKYHWYSKNDLEIEEKFTGILYEKRGGGYVNWDLAVEADPGEYFDSRANLLLPYRFFNNEDI